MPAWERAIMSGAATQSTTLDALPGYQVSFHRWLMDGDPSLGGWCGGVMSKEFDPPASLNYSFKYWGDAMVNPYDSASVYDPSDDMDDLGVAVEDFVAVVEDLDHYARWQVFLPVVQAAALVAFPNTIPVDVVTRINTFETQSLPSFYRSLNRMSGALFDADASEGSAHVLGMAILERGRRSDMAEFRARLEDENMRVVASARAQFILQSLQQLAIGDATAVDKARDIYSIKDSYYRLKIVSNKEFVAEELEYDAAYLTWFPHLAREYALPVLAGMNGASALQKGPSKASTAISTGLAFAAQGVQLGSVGGPGGAIAGGLIGGVLGLLAGAL
jgi:hypothetical protein